MNVHIQTDWRDTTDFARNFRRRKRLNRIFQTLFLLATVFAVVVLAVLLYTVFRDGISYLNWTFLTGFPSRFVEKSGIYAGIVGTLWVIGLTIPLILIIGVSTAIYLEEYQSRNWWTDFIQTNINNLAGVPSIIYGILGLAIFVRMLHFGNSILAGAFTMALLVLPIVIVASQEALRAVPATQRAASYALGATKWQTVVRVVLPSALPGILTGTILAISRAIGETAPLILVGAVTFIRFAPTSVFDRFTVLPMQIYHWVTLPQAEFHGLAAAAIIVLLAVLLFMNAFAIWVRNRFQKHA